VALLLQEKGTPLLLATENHHIQVVEMLIKAGADVDSPEIVREKGPLHFPFIIPYYYSLDGPHYMLQHTLIRLN